MATPAAATILRRWYSSDAFRRMSSFSLLMVYYNLPLDRLAAAVFTGQRPSTHASERASCA